MSPVERSGGKDWEEVNRGGGVVIDEMEEEWRRAEGVCCEWWKVVRVSSPATNE
jgi:hypothetical protein